MIQFSCSTCGEMIEVADTSAGTTEMCPLCGAAITVPGAPSLVMVAEDYRRPRTLRAILILSGIVTLVVVCGIMMSIGLKEAYYEANRTQCKGRLKQLGAALAAYSAANRGLFPSLYSHSSDPRSAKEVWGGDWDPATFELHDRDQGPTAGIGTHRPMTSNTHCLWLLVREEMDMEGMLICPEDMDAEEGFSATPADWWDFKNLGACSYSFQNQLGRTTSVEGHADIVVAADKCPMRPDAAASAGAAAAPGAMWYNQNSPNHFMRGQNVLFLGGSVDWRDTPNCGYKGDNIWTKGTWDASTGKWQPLAAPRYDRYDEGIDHKWDSWLVP